MVTCSLHEAGVAVDGGEAVGFGGYSGYLRCADDGIVFGLDWGVEMLWLQ
jgi:hypothetical protein